MIFRPLSLFLLVFALSSTPQLASDFTATVSKLASEGEGKSAVTGAAEPWRFVTKELSHLAKGDLAAAPDLKALNVEGTDPLPVIQEYAAALKVLGVDLVLVPVPAKATIYPDKLSADLAPDDAPSLKPFLNKIAATGISVIDLETLYKKHRESNPDEAVYCATDSHWSPLGAQLAAKAVAEKLADHASLTAATKTSFTVGETEDLSFHGDLFTDEEKASLPTETLPLKKVSPDSIGDSPLLVIGDSHCQVFHSGGNMLATSAGFIDHLAAALSIQVGEISSQASGADQPRADIARNTARDPQFWDTRKVVVWLFTAREFTQGKWRTIPAKVVRK